MYCGNVRGAGRKGSELKKRHKHHRQTPPSPTPSALNIMASIKIATLNINGITPSTRIAMLDSFHSSQEVDILLVQEDQHYVVNDFQAYTRNTISEQTGGLQPSSREMESI